MHTYRGKVTPADRRCPVETGSGDRAWREVQGVWLPLPSNLVKPAVASCFTTSLGGAGAIKILVYATRHNRVYVNRRKMKQRGTT